MDNQEGSTLLFAAAAASESTDPDASLQSANDARPLDLNECGSNISTGRDNKSKTSNNSCANTPSAMGSGSSSSSSKNTRFGSSIFRGHPSGVSWKRSPATADTPASQNNNDASQQSCGSQSMSQLTQSQSQEIMTQNAELTQQGDFDDTNSEGPGFLSPMQPYSPTAPLRVPWGRIMPCSPHADKGVDLLPRPPADNNGNPPKQQQQLTKSSPQYNLRPTGAGVMFQGIPNLLPQDIFNEYVIGRSPKCDVLATKPPKTAAATTTTATKTAAAAKAGNTASAGGADDNDENEHERQQRDGSSQKKKRQAAEEWAYGMISNRHCRIYCSLVAPANATTKAAVPGIMMEVYIEDSSGNGTLINQTTLLRRGEKRRLHSGDEICLVNPATLKKKIRSQESLLALLQQHSFVFVNLDQLQARVPSFHATVTGGRQLQHTQQQHQQQWRRHHQQQQQETPRQKRLSFGSPTTSTKRKAAVDVRATKQHSWQKAAGAEAASDSAAKQQQRCFPSTAASDINNTTHNLLQTEKSSGGNASSSSCRKQRRIEEEYDIRDLLGSGTVGTVRRAIHRKTGVERAVKIISIGVGGRGPASQKLKFSQANASLTIEAEASILQGLDHPYVVKLIDVFVSATTVYLVMELLTGGDLFDRIVEKDNYSELESRRVMRRLLTAVYYLHEERNIVHRDLKPENILLMSRESDVEIKLTDFGVAKHDDGLKTFCGTPQYFAPEVLQRRTTVIGRGRYGKSADMWSVGVILYILLSGTPPFDVASDNLGDDGPQILFPDEYWAGISESAKDLILKLLVVEPDKRLTVKQACRHDWICLADGDTHSYPLDDPRLVVGSKKGIVPGTENASDRKALNLATGKNSTDNAEQELDRKSCAAVDNCGDTTLSRETVAERMPNGNGCDPVSRPEDENKETKNGENSLCVSITNDGAPFTAASKGKEVPGVEAAANNEIGSAVETLAASDPPSRQVEAAAKAAPFDDSHDVAKVSDVVEGNAAVKKEITVEEKEQQPETEYHRVKDMDKSPMLPSRNVPRACRVSSPTMNSSANGSGPSKTQERCPLSPVSLNERPMSPLSLNERHAQFRDQILAVTVKDNDVNTETTPLQPGPSIFLPNLVSKATGDAPIGNKGTVRYAYDQNAVTPTCGLVQTSEPPAKSSERNVQSSELSDDEIFSEFSGKTDSISSFSTGTNDETEQNGSKNEDKKSSSTKSVFAAVTKNSRRQKRKRESKKETKKKRRTAQSDRDKKNSRGKIEPSKTIITTNVRRKSRPGKSKIETTKDQTCTGPKQTRGRQTKLSNWFKKNKSN